MSRDPVAKPDAPLAQSAELLEGVQVLVVDDNTAMREMLEVVLEHYGAEVKTAASASEALDMIGHSLPDVLVSDIAMPGQDGYGLIRQVRSLKPEQGGRIPALALTAWGGSEDRLRALTAGFQNHLVKPADADELAMLVAHLAKTVRAAD
jgi:CheY-like chemotaxis protein